MTKFCTWFARAVLAALLAPGGQAIASSYAVSYDTIGSFTLTFGGGAANLSPFTFSADAALTDYGGSASVKTKDAKPACLNCSYSNSYMAHGSATEYAYGDAQIVSSNVTGGVGAARDIGEVSAVDSIGLAFGTNAMDALFWVYSVPGKVNFSFSALPYMNTALTAGGTNAKAGELMSISIYNLSNTKVFEWKPNGAVGGVLGGTESADSFSLNSEISANGLYNPGSGSFAAATNNLAPGKYFLNITMANYVSAASSAVPLPAGVWLFGSGLLSLIGFSRRKKPE